MSAADADLERLAWATAASLGIFAAFSGFHRHAFDAFVHMFFASHYAGDWFELWEPRWYGGFSVVSYPPLAHQLVALGSKVLGYEAAYVTVMVTAMVLTPWCVGQAARAFVDDRAAAWAMLAASLWPTAHRFAWVYGQLPMLVATPFALVAMGRLHQFVVQGRVTALLAFVACVGATAGAHHVTSIFVAGGCLLVGIRHLLSPGAGGRKQVVLRGLVAAAGAAIAILGVIWPFWRFAQGAPQTEIPHVSRDPLWLRPFSLELVEMGVVFTVAAGLTLWALLKQRALALAVVAFGAVGLSVLSTGTTTPLPSILFGSQWRWLTYDKFHHWAALLMCVPLGAALASVAWRQSRLAGWVAALLLPFAVFLVGHKTGEALQPPYVHDLVPVLEVVNRPDAHQYRHLALGFGDQFCRIDIYGQSPNADGDYHTARNDPTLRESGVATLDASKYYPKGFEVLKSVLQRADALSLRWVFVNDEAYYPPLFESGFELAEVWPNGISMFERVEVPPLVENSNHLKSLHWGLVPPLTALAAVVLMSLARRARLAASD